MRRFPRGSRRMTDPPMHVAILTLPTVLEQQEQQSLPHCASMGEPDCLTAQLFTKVGAIIWVRKQVLEVKIELLRLALMGSCREAARLPFERGQRSSPGCGTHHAMCFKPQRQLVVCCLPSPPHALQVLTGRGKSAHQYEAARLCRHRLGSCTTAAGSP